MSTIYVNGKFLAQRTTGVQRVAHSLLKALDTRQGGLPGRWVLLCPPDSELPILKNIEVRRLGRFPGPLHGWEQTTLPWASQGGLLLNLSGSAPWFGHHQACILHDAAVFDAPLAYTAVFVQWYRALFQHLARQNGPLLTVSEHSRDRLALHLHIDRARIAVVPNGGDHLDGVVADPGALARLGLLNARFLLVVASDNPSKNINGLLAAFARLSDRSDRADYRLVIVGGGNTSVFARGSLQGSQPGVVRAGNIDDAGLKALYQSAVALVLPSFYEGFGLPALEAMQCACPVIASNLPALREVCADAALYVDPYSVDDIASAMRRVLDDSALRESLRAAGLARASQWRWAASAERLLAALPIGAQA